VGGTCNNVGHGGAITMFSDEGNGSPTGLLVEDWYYSFVL
jgi:hypothetical protein